jgi:hypothetical protein
MVPWNVLAANKERDTERDSGAGWGSKADAVVAHEAGREREHKMCRTSNGISRSKGNGTKRTK